MGEYHHKPTIEVSFFYAGAGGIYAMYNVHICMYMNEWILHNV